MYILYCSFHTVIPIITTPPFDTIGIFNKTSNLTCQAFGSPVPNITWIKDGTQLDPFNDFDLSTDTYVNEFTRTSILFFTNLDFDYSGCYVCRAVNTVSKNATFIVNRKCFLIYNYMCVCIIFSTRLSYR